MTYTWDNLERFDLSVNQNHSCNINQMRDVVRWYKLYIQTCILVSRVVNHCGQFGEVSDLPTDAAGILKNGLPCGGIKKILEKQVLTVLDIAIT